MNDTTAPEVKHGRIDVHHHLFPPAYVEENRRRGITKEAGVQIPTWVPEDSLGVMDANGIQTAILSLSAPGVYMGSRQDAITLARECNDYGAALVQQHPGRFGYFAVLPMPFTAEACAEAIRALEVLGADGIVLLGSTDGVFLGDPRFEELMAELNRRKAVVFVHPNVHPTSRDLWLATPDFLLEFVCDTTRAAVNLVLQGVMERHPGIKWILAHAGGFLPYIAWRASLANALPQFRDTAPQGVLTYLRRFYFDTALSPSSITMAALQQFVAPEHILFGSDYPYAPAPLTALQVKTLEEGDIWSEAQQHGIQRQHALSLFPRFAQADEDFNSAPEFSKEGLLAKAARLATDPLAEMVEHLRNR
ncbi:amidohydrolase [Massilia sp. BJB1822]|nr:amidohydrolase [Massilia sp. BJB1822]